MLQIEGDSAGYEEGIDREELEKIEDEEEEMEV